MDLGREESTDNSNVKSDYARRIERRVIVLNLQLVTDNSELITVNPE